MRITKHEESKRTKRTKIGKTAGSRRKVGSLALAALLLGGMAAGCSIGKEQAKQGSDYTTAYTAEDVDPSLAEGMNEFALNFYAMLEKQPGEDSPGPNRMVSPAGIAIALSMLKAGAEGQTDRELEQVLNLSGMNAEQLGAAQQVMRELLRGADPSIRMEIANSFWSRQGFQLKPDYVKSLEQYYEAQARALDFDSDKAAPTINAWISDNTAGKIRDVIKPPIDGDTVLFLINAMYFKGSWTEPFKAEQTGDLPFTTAEGEEIQVPTMKQRDKYDYLDADGFRAIRLPYGESKNFGMILALPDEGRTLEQFKRQDLPAFDTWSAELSRQEGSVELPKFKLEDSLSLNDALIALGMPSAFDPSKAELGGIADTGDRRLYVSKASHDTFIEVNEEGTEAAAVTVIEGATSSAPVENKPFNLKLNRPFFFAITDRTTGLIVFMGEVGNPSES
ncbi:serpin family protein [Saccharibacillus sp. CPCC 101409]|uniref:serpin family protein n=1 Tax=Saccharibacillus sp. CPCC 101409 TaxID=3058041 RepID=UPI0026732FF9|nr:serpin family protein [Saccharibacillus sp. CPCC 101409]MDO3409485.1 serpin family protein [Saccharibacillus sp. CPCC 101409]